MTKMRALVMTTLIGMALAACARTTVVDSRSGAQLFANYCAACHGPVGEGDGPVASIMNTNVPNLRTLAQRNGGTFPRETVRAYIDGRTLPAGHGDRQMPIWGDIFGWGGEASQGSEALAEMRINAIVDHLATLQH